MRAGWAVGGRKFLQFLKVGITLSLMRYDGIHIYYSRRGRRSECSGVKLTRAPLSFPPVISALAFPLPRLPPYRYPLFILPRPLSPISRKLSTLPFSTATMRSTRGSTEDSPSLPVLRAIAVFPFPRGVCHFRLKPKPSTTTAKAPARRARYSSIGADCRYC